MAAKQLSSARLSVLNVSQKHKNMSLHLGWLQHIPLFVCVVDVCARWFVILMNLLPFHLFALSSWLLAMCTCCLSGETPLYLLSHFIGKVWSNIQYAGCISLKQQAEKAMSASRLGTEMLPPSRVGVCSRFLPIGELFLATVIHCSWLLWMRSFGFSLIVLPLDVI